jgi:hypothetical protein
LVRGSLLLAYYFKEIVPEIRRDGVVLQDAVGFLVVSQRAFKEVEGTVVFVVDQVL